MKLILSMLALLLMSGTANAFNIKFKSSAAEFDDATSAYAQIWQNEGSKITKAMERISKIEFNGRSIQAIIFGGMSSSGEGDKPMYLRASYRPETKKATLIHELGHRLLADIPITSEIQEHNKLFLILYDVWVDLYGTEFANLHKLNRDSI